MAKRNKKGNGEESVKVNAGVKERVKTHVDKIGGKIGKFFTIAAVEKLEKDSQILEEKTEEVSTGQGK